MIKTFALSGDLGRPAVILACALALLGLGLLAVELWRGSRSRGSSLRIAASGVLAVVGLLAAVLRPVSIVSKGSLVGPRVVVLADASRSIDLPGDDGTRRQSLSRALGALDKRSSEVRLSLYSFGVGPAAPIGEASARAPDASLLGGEPAGAPSFRVRPVLGSDLGAALESIARAADERPAAIVVLSDGRLDRPGETATAEAVRGALGQLSVPVHTVALAERAPADASIRKILAAGAAVAHQPFSLRIEVGCDGGLACGDVPVIARELRDAGPPAKLAEGIAHVVNGKATIELSVTVERAGTRILEVAIQPPEGDAIPENNRRLFTIDVTRDRVRVLHVAGRPTYDVRALRMWLKSDASVDVVAFFILRTHESQVQATSDELALIPFPVDELFTEQLPTFDAVVLQDFNAAPYGLTKHLSDLAKYVRDGGGLIMVGGPGSFVGGHYAGTAIAPVLPVELDSARQSSAVDLAWFSPQITESGRTAPVLAPLRALIGDDLPDMPGANVVGDARPGATVLMTHPTRRTPKGAPMPILTLGESGSGRTMALAIDGSHRLLFSDFAARDAGRAHGAFWDAMLGWLMRDPRFEPAVIDLKGGCIAGEDATVVLRPLAGQRGKAVLKIQRLGSTEPMRTRETILDGNGKPVELPIGALEAAGYSAEVEIVGAGGKGPTTRRDFACEKGGDEWADSRPDADRLKEIAKTTGGKYVTAADAGTLPLPPAMQVAAERQVAPLLPAWAWAIGAAMMLGAHWIVRRLSGLS
ncbi:MAG: glutamine amidotransferase [Minicystis sp.]